MVPLLQAPLENPQATLITLFINAIEETLSTQDRLHGLTEHSPVTKRLLKYLPLKGRSSSRYDPALIQFNVGRDLVTTYDHLLDR